MKKTSSSAGLFAAAVILVNIFIFSGLMSCRYPLDCPDSPGVEEDGSSGGEGTIEVTGVNIKNPYNLQNMDVGDEGQLYYAVFPANATNKAATWSSSKPNIAAISSSGVVTALAPGSVIITITTICGGQTDSIGIYIIGPPPADNAVITIEPSNNFSLFVSGTTNLNVVITPLDTDQRVSWTSSNPGVAKAEEVMGNLGRVTALTTGNATITATSVLNNNVTGTASVTVNPAAITIVPASAATFTTGETRIFSATRQPENLNITWSVTAGGPAPAALPLITWQWPTLLR